MRDSGHLERTLIDQNAIAALVQQQITDAVKNQISLLLADPAWIDRIEKRAVDVLANKIEARFSRLNEDPELSQAEIGRAHV